MYSCSVFSGEGGGGLHRVVQDWYLKSLRQSSYFPDYYLTLELFTIDLNEILKAKWMQGMYNLRFQETGDISIENKKRKTRCQVPPKTPTPTAIR